MLFSRSLLLFPNSISPMTIYIHSPSIMTNWEELVMWLAVCWLTLKQPQLKALKAFVSQSASYYEWWGPAWKQSENSFAKFTFIHIFTVNHILSNHTHTVQMRQTNWLLINKACILYTLHHCYFQFLLLLYRLLTNRFQGLLQNIVHWNETCWFWSILSCRLCGPSGISIEFK